MEKLRGHLLGDESIMVEEHYLNRQIADMAAMPAEVVAWERDRYIRTRKIDWQFTMTDARITVKRLYPK